MRGSVRRDRDVRVPAWGERGASQRVLLLVLLLVVVLFGYVYFFTGIITPREEQASPKPAEPQVVKKPIPSRTEKAAAGKETPGPQQKPKEAAAPNAVKAPESPKAAPPKAQVAQAPKKEPAKQAPTAAPKQAPAATVPAKTAQPDKKATEKKAAAAAVGDAKKAPASKKAACAYALFVGDFVLDRDMKRTEAKLKKAGIAQFTIRKGKKAEPMHRLHVADFGTRKEAEAELKKLLNLNGASFVLPANGKYALYAGSYFQEAQAVKEKDRLTKKDIKVTVQKAEVKIPVKVLTAGSFPTKDQAQKAAERISKMGIPATVTTAKK